MSAEAFVVLIPARMASSRLPDKPLANIAGKAMVVHCCERAALSGASRIVVATDDARVVQTVQAAGFEAVLTRSDHPSGTDRLAEAAELLGLPDQTIVVNLQGDEPLIAPTLLRDVAARLAARPDAVMCTVVHPLRDLASFINPAVVKVVCDARGDASWFSRAPLPWPRDAFSTGPTQWPPDFQALRHVGLYAYRRHFLPTYTALAIPACERAEALEQLRVLHYGHRIACVMVDEAPPSGVDTAEDLARVRALFDRTPAGRVASSP